jgi:hypothetical protein
MRRTVLCALLSCLWLLPIQAQPLRPRQDPELERCANVRVLDPAQFAGQTLIETPDVTAPQMRLANMLVSSGCRDEATSLMAEYLRGNGGDAQVAYVYARLTWITEGGEAADESSRIRFRSIPHSFRCACCWPA